MAGGERSRLHPLTGERSEPAVSCGGRDLLVDFLLRGYGLCVWRWSLRRRHSGPWFAARV